MAEVNAKIGGEIFPLLYNGYAMFAVRNKYGAEPDMFEKISKQDQEGFSALCDVVETLAEQAELLRRYRGHEERKTPKAEEIQLLVSPVECAVMRQAVLEAVMKGFGREVKEEESDLGLAELEQKKTTKSRKQSISK